MLSRFCPHQIARRVEDIDLQQLRAEGVRGLLLDLDNTLTRWQSEELSPSVTAWLEQATRQFRVCLLSNAVRGQRVRRMAERLGVPCVHGLGPWGKPWRRAFQAALRQTGTTPEETAMIGDQLFTDICGARRMGLRALLVEPVGQREFLLTTLNRRVARWVEGLLRRRGEWPTEYCSSPSPPSPAHSDQGDHETER
ncbi:MAG: YqeG family HAD IIIA-type phosphatase [candidate division WS1 bacterium]|nr:YqeG family HAD IIIA-type phosphatase [candidate division WS1 bacterium]